MYLTKIFFLKWPNKVKSYYVLHEVKYFNFYIMLICIHVHIPILTS